jgi:hypothetical protein
MRRVSEQDLDIASAAGGEGDEPELRRTPLSDLFATALHRFGSAWADLVLASLAFLAVASVPVLVVHHGSARVSTTVAVGAFSYAIGYFSLLAHVVLRGLPARPDGRRRAGAYAVAVVSGALAAVAIILLAYLAVVVLPLVLLAVPAAAAGDAAPYAAIPRGALLALRNFSRTWGVWLVSLLFSAPVWVCFALLALPLLSGASQFFVTLLLAAPIIWPFTALFLRALYGDLTGRLVVAPEDRTG